MARSRINDVTQDLITDDGAVLWSFVMGEQLEFPVILNFLSDVTQPGYEFEAVVVEALNVSGQEEKPVTIRPLGVQTILTVRLPSYQGAWSSTASYNAEDVVLHNGVYYKLLSGAGYIDDTEPQLDTNWEESGLNRVYIQFPSTLGSTWTVGPIANAPVYGFFELRVTEPSNSILQRTWKPIRGLVELLFSPTDIVPDV